MSDIVPGPEFTRPILPGIPSQGTPDQIRRVAEDFEATFLSQMLRPMFQGLSTEAPFGGGAGEETWRSFLLDAMAQKIVEGRGIGLADQVQRELLALQGGPPSPINGDTAGDDSGSDGTGSETLPSNTDHPRT